MNTRPILFSALMVQKLLKKEKFQTRRILKFTPEIVEAFDKRPNTSVFLNGMSEDFTKVVLVVGGKIFIIKNKYGVPGDVFWVRETLYQNGELSLEYAADRMPIEEEIIPGDFNVRIDKNGQYKFCKIPNIYMEKWAGRLFLKIKNIWIERLNDIAFQDAIDEGISESYEIVSATCAGGSHQEISGYRYRYDDKEQEGFESPEIAYKSLWESINGSGSWDKNPLVFCIEFEYIDRPENFL